MLKPLHDFGVDQWAFEFLVPNMANAAVSEIDHALSFDLPNQTFTRIPVLRKNDLMEAPVELFELGKTEYKMEETNLSDSDHEIFLNAACLKLGVPFAEEHHATHEITYEVVERIGCIDGLNLRLINHSLPG